jgi:kynurenine formamidase
MKLYDLSQPLYDSPPTWPGFPEVKIKSLIHHSKDGICAKEITCCTHASTHIDAPWHFMGGLSMTVDKLPLEMVSGTGVVLDIPKNDLEEITARDLEAATPKVQKGDIVLIVTGWYRDEIWFDETRYMIKFPGLVKDAVDWLVARGVKVVGSDIPCIDHPYQTPLVDARRDIFTKPVDREKYPLFYAHYGLLGNNIPIIELVGGEVASVLRTRVNVMAFPLKIKGGDASPVRVVAFKE